MPALELGKPDRLLAIAGPTASGKSEVALHLAELLNGEIISVDSMQVYRGMDIGTAKPSLEERSRVPHHLIDVVDLSAPFDAAQFVRLAKEAVTAIRGRKRIPILCGGTGLYFKAFFAGLGEAPPASPEMRAELEKLPLEMLLRELAQKDPQTYEQIDRQNSRRVVRALEVIRTTGKPFSTQKARWSEKLTLGDSPWIVGLEREDLELKKRINTRVDRMFRNGLVEETQELFHAGLSRNRTALQALGYRQVVEHLQGARSLLETIELVKVRTRQFAKRQRTWFKGQLPTQWKHVSAGESAGTVAQSIVENWQARP